MTPKLVAMGGGLLVGAVGLAYVAWATLSNPSAAVAEAQHVRMLEERVNTLQARLQTAQPSPSHSAPLTPAKVMSAEELQRAREESRRRHFDAHAEMLKTHAAQPMDHSWASSAAESFRADLHGLRKESRAKVVNVDCRTNSCVATLEWPSFHDAKSGFSALLHALYKVNCVRTITLPDPPDPSKPYSGTAIFLKCQKPAAQK